MHEVSVIGITRDRLTGVPIIILVSEDESFALPIWVGEYEAEFLETHLLGAVPPRPFPYDLLKNVIDNLGATVERVIIDRFDGQIYYATVHLRDSEGNLIEIDARPSDSINLAVRSDCPIYVSQTVLERSAIKLDNAHDETLEDVIEKIIDDIFGGV